MKPIVPFFILLVLFQKVALSQNSCEEGECFSATVDDKFFNFRENRALTAALIREQASMDGRMPERTFISIILQGHSYITSGGRLFNELVELEIPYHGNIAGDSVVAAAALQYDSVVYSGTEGKLNTASLSWNGDLKSFTLTATYECVVRSWGYPIDEKADVVLKGYLDNIKVTVPPWLVAKN